MDIIKYYWPEAWDNGIKVHWQKDVESLGMKIFKYRVFGISDCVIMQVENLPANLPSHIKVDTRTSPEELFETINNTNETKIIYDGTKESLEKLKNALRKGYIPGIN